MLVYPKHPKFKIPYYFLEETKESLQELHDDLYLTLFWSRVDSLLLEGKTRGKDTQEEWLSKILSLEKDPQAVLMRLQDEASIAAFETSQFITETGDMLRTRFMSAIRHNASWRRAEAGSLQEFIMEKIPSLQENAGEMYEILFMVEVVLPEMESMGIEVSKLSRKIYSKVKNSVSFMRKEWKRLASVFESNDEKIEKMKKDIEKKKRQAEKAKGKERAMLLEEVSKLEHEKELEEEKIEEQNNKTRDSVQDSFAKAFEMIIDPTVPAAGVDGIRTRLSGGGEKIKLNGSVMMAPGTTTFVVQCSSRFESVVKSSLHFVDFNVVDGQVLINELKESMKGKNK